MEPNEQTELTSKTETDSQIESTVTAKEDRVRVEGLSKKEKGLIAGGGEYKGTKW